MSPRPYQLGKRQEQIDESRQRVIDAARSLLAQAARVPARLLWRRRRTLAEGSPHRAQNSNSRIHAGPVRFRWPMVVGCCRFRVTLEAASVQIHTLLTEYSPSGIAPYLGIEQGECAPTPDAAPRK